MAAAGDPLWGAFYINSGVVFTDSVKKVRLELCVLLRGGGGSTPRYSGCKIKSGKMAEV